MRTEHVIELPTLSRKEMESLRQKPAEFDLLQGLALSLYDEQAGFCMALAGSLSSRKGKDSKLVQEMLETKIANLRAGDPAAWRSVCQFARKRPDSPVCKIVLKLSPLGKREAAA